MVDIAVLKYKYNNKIIQLLNTNLNVKWCSGWMLPISKNNILRIISNLGDEASLRGYNLAIGKNGNSFHIFCFKNNRY